MLIPFIKDTHRLDAFKETFCKTKRYPYTHADLDILTKKAAIFLLQHFRKVYMHCGQSHVHKMKRYPDYKLAALDTIVNVKCLPAGYNTKHPPSVNTCDHCGHILVDGHPQYNGNVLICGHAYHSNCLQLIQFRCNHCEQYYLEGIRFNVSSFLKRLERGSPTLTNEEQELDEEEGDEEIEETGEGVAVDNSVMLQLQRELYLMDVW
jgi:hypothetical protein